jgi:hypothetical protein
MANHSKARTEAEAKFKKTQKAQRAAEGSQAMSEYVAAGHAVRTCIFTRTKQPLRFPQCPILQLL